MGAIAGVLIADYWLVRRKWLRLPDLYRTRGVYAYSGGWNWRAVVATLAGCFLAWIGAFVPALATVYSYAWFVGFGASFVIHYALMKMVPPSAATEVEPEALERQAQA
jgi:NCS1 family nucleobase:cation symporter-1